MLCNLWCKSNLISIISYFTARVCHNLAACQRIRRCRWRLWLAYPTVTSFRYVPCVAFVACVALDGNPALRRLIRPSSNICAEWRHDVRPSASHFHYKRQTCHTQPLMEMPAFNFCILLLAVPVAPWASIIWWTGGHVPLLFEVRGA